MKKEEKEESDEKNDERVGPLVSTGKEKRKEQKDGWREVKQKAHLSRGALTPLSFIIHTP